MSLDNPFYNLDRESLLSSSMMTIWDHLSMGVVIVDENGICCYMNKLQRAADGFSTRSVVGAHITSLYQAHEFDSIPTMEVLRTGKPLHKLVYWYKTVDNQLVNSLNDFFPLFRDGVPDGAISFTISLGAPSLGKTARKNALSARREAPEIPLFLFDNIVGNDRALRRLVTEARKAAQSSAPVMIWGESGSGKELFAQAIHAEGARADKPFVPINCAAIPETLLESMLFGTVKGTYTDATEKPGLFEEANGGTLVFDELNSMPLGLQAKLLRVIQEKRVRRLGSHVEIPIDVRVISILNEQPLRAMELGLLRRDLYYRLAVIGIAVPALRQRKEDILPLSRFFLEQFTTSTGRPLVELDEEVQRMFLDYSWPGNVRELQHVIEGTVALLNSGDIIHQHDLPKHFLDACIRRDTHSTASASNTARQTAAAASSYFDYEQIEFNTALPLKSCMREYEERCIRNVLRHTGGNVAKAARILEMKSSSLHYRIKALNIDIMG